MDTLLTHHWYACSLLLNRIQLVALSQSIEFYSNQWDDDFDEHSFQRSYYTSTSLFVKLVYIQNWSFRLGIRIEEKLGQYKQGVNHFWKWVFFYFCCCCSWRNTFVSRWASNLKLGQLPLQSQQVLRLNAGIIHGRPVLDVSLTPLPQELNSMQCGTQP